ncbi:MAG: hypothetical protein EA416_13565 [Trueperaceae bacterium]|nr:MAG: hypothetical protein EA416_13565 [Trueperaceae bacterium]
MKRFAALTGVLALLMVGGMVWAMGEDHGPVEHGHVLVLGLQYDDEGNPSIRKCVDLANGRALRNNAHHDHLHTGRAGEAVAGAGHAVIPTAPLPRVPWSNCAELKAEFGLD